MADTLLNSLHEKPKIEVPKDFYDELDKKSKPELIGIIIQLAWEIQEFSKLQQEIANGKKIVTPG